MIQTQGNLKLTVKYNKSKTLKKTFAALKVCVSKKKKKKNPGLHGNRATGLITVSALCVIGRFSREHHSLSK